MRRTQVPATHCLISERKIVAPSAAAAEWIVKVSVISPVSTHYVKVYLERSRVNAAVPALETTGIPSDCKALPRGVSRSMA